MADNILRLRVDSQEYDAKLKKAAEGIRHLAEVAHQGGGELTGLEKAELDYIKSLGTMETKSRTAAGSVRELENTFKELTVVYNQLNDVEKQDEGGKALAASLDQLKQRAQAARAELDNASKALKDNGQSAQQSGGILESLAGKFTLNIDALKLFDMGLSATKAALDVAKDAFFASESNVDEWGRTVAASQSLYEGFLTAINNGDISGYLSNMDSIVKAARQAYDELDKLGTMETIQAPQISKQQLENERIRSMIQTGRYIAPQDGRKNAVFNGREMQTGDKLTAGQIRALEKQLQGGMQKVVKLVGNEVDQTGKAINAYYDKLAKTNGMSFQEFKKGTSSWAEFNKRMQGYEQYKEWDKQARTEFAKQGGRGNVDFDKSNPFAEFRKWGTFRVDKNGDSSYKDLVNLIRQRDQKVGQVYSTQAQAYRTMNRAEGFTVSKLMGNGGKSKQQQAEDKVAAALQDYQQTIDKASLELKSGATTEADVKKKQLSAQERLYDAYGDAYALYKDPKYKAAQDKAAEEIVKLGGEVKAATEAQEAAKKAARELESAQKKLADAQTELANAQASGDLKQIYAAEKKVETAQTNLTNVQSGGTASPVVVPVSLTTGNLEAFTSHIKEELAKADLGSSAALSLQEGLSDATAIGTILQTAIQNGIDTAQFDTSGLMQKLMNHEDISDDVIQQYVDELNAKLMEKFDETEWPNVLITFDADTKNIVNAAKQQEQEAQKMAKNWQAAGSAIQAVGAAMNQIEDPAAKVLGTIAQAVATMALSYSQAAASPAVTSTGWGWIAFAATGVATMLSSIAAIKQATSGFANGGVIPGNSMSGDNLRGITPDGTVYGLNSQEIILNRAQQGNLASQLEGGGMENLHLDTVISAEEIRLVLNNNGRRTGRGEYVQTNRR